MKIKLAEIIGQTWWVTPVIPAASEAEIGRIAV
jgi:hypothetical protein